MDANRVRIEPILVPLTARKNVRRWSCVLARVLHGPAPSCGAIAAGGEKKKWHSVSPSPLPCFHQAHAGDVVACLPSESMTVELRVGGVGHEDQAPACAWSGYDERRARPHVLDCRARRPDRRALNRSRNSGRFTTNAIGLPPSRKRVIWSKFFSSARRARIPASRCNPSQCVDASGQRAVERRRSRQR